MKALWIIFGATLFIGFHLIVGAGALAYAAHLFGFDIPFLDHHHGCGPA